MNAPVDTPWWQRETTRRSIITTAAQLSALASAIAGIVDERNRGPWLITAAVLQTVTGILGEWSTSAARNAVSALAEKTVPTVEAVKPVAEAVQAAAVDPQQAVVVVPIDLAERGATFDPGTTVLPRRGTDG